MFSNTGYGCCHLGAPTEAGALRRGIAAGFASEIAAPLVAFAGTNAVCCGEQSCCPAGYVCQNTPPWSSACVPASEPNSTNTIPATTVCTPGPLYGPDHSALPSQIVIGDSVSIGYTPVVTSLLNGSVFVQHSPYAGGGGADDTGNGLTCIEEFVHTSTMQPANWSL